MEFNLLKTNGRENLNFKSIGNNSNDPSIRDYLDKTEMKIQEYQIKRLLEKVKIFTKTEFEL